MKVALKTMWQLMWHIPIGVAWVCMYLFISLGWGLRTGDLFMKHWNNFIEEDYDRREKDLFG